MVKFIRADISNDPRRFDSVVPAVASALNTVLPIKKAADLDIIQELWRETFSSFDGTPKDQNDPLVWRILLALLNKSRDGAFWEAKMDDADGTGAEAKVTTVLDSRHRVMAPLAEILRAREILETLGLMKDVEGIEDKDPRLLSEKRIMRALKAKWDFHTKPAAPSVVPPNEKADETRKRVLKRPGQWNSIILIDPFPSRPLTTRDRNLLRRKGNWREWGGACLCRMSARSSEAIKTGSIVRLNEELTYSVASYAYTSWHNTPRSSSAQTINTDDGAAAREKPGEDGALLQDKRAPELAQRFFNLQSTPALSRLFMLVVDCEIELSEIPLNGLYYLCLADTTGPKFDATVVQTLAGLSGSDGQNSFWQR